MMEEGRVVVTELNGVTTFWGGVPDVGEASFLRGEAEDLRAVSEVVVDTVAVVAV